MWSDFSTKMNAAGMPSGMFQFMKPWMAALTLTPSSLRRPAIRRHRASTPTSGIAPERPGSSGWPSRPWSSRSACSPNLTPEQSLEFLAFTIADLETIIPLMEELATSWRAGNVAYVQDVTVSEFDELSRPL